MTKAQSIKAISGKVVNKNNEPMMGSALLLSVRDSTIIKQHNFLEGEFQLSDINQKEVLMKLTSVEFADMFLHISYEGKENVNLGSVIISEKNNQLNEVVIKSQMPLLKYAANGTISVNVANTLLATSNSVNELLGRVPNVVVSEGQVSVLGRAKP
jgi:hypothetical protein